jgi:cation:H+ antiporter
MLVDVLLVLGGLVLLAAGADWLIKGSVAAATALNVSKLVIGLTVVALGTSAPELVTAIRAALVGEPGIVLGNAIGSNTANLGLVLGVAALLGRIPVTRRITTQDTPLLLGITGVTFLLAVNLQISRIDGAVLTGLAILLMLLILRQKPEMVKEAEQVAPPQLAWWLTTLLIVVGLAGLAFGAWLLVAGARSIAADLGVSGTFIGATVVALGTSAPELAASIAAAYRRHHDLVLGNLIGSCQFNLALIVGVPALIQPLEVSTSVLYFHLPALVVVSLAAWLMMRSGRIVLRREGLILLLLYLAYCCGAYLAN